MRLVGDAHEANGSMAQLLSVIPRLRRLGRLLLADQTLADRLLLAALRARGRAVEAEAEADAFLISAFRLATACFETDARALPSVAPFGSPAGAPEEGGLLTRYWSLPFEHRLVVALTMIESFTLAEAAAITGRTEATLAQSAAQALQRLSDRPAAPAG